MLTSLPGASNDALGLWTNMDSWNLLIQLLVELQTAAWRLIFESQWGSSIIFPCLPGWMEHAWQRWVSTINQSMRSSWIKGQKGSKRVKAKLQITGITESTCHTFVQHQHGCEFPAFQDGTTGVTTTGDIQQLGFSPTPTPFQKKKMCWKHLKN